MTEPKRILLTYYLTNGLTVAEAFSDMGTAKDRLHQVRILLRNYENAENLDNRLLTLEHNEYTDRTTILPIRSIVYLELV